MASQPAASKQSFSNQTALIESGFFKMTVEKCTGCDRVIEVKENRYCSTYANPEAKWRNGICNFATHAKLEIVAAKAKVNPLKASKRAMAKKKK